MGHDLGLTVNVSTWVTEITEEKGEFDDSFLGGDCSRFVLLLW